MATNEKDRFIGNRIREERVLAGLSQTALGQRVGIYFQQIQRYEKAINRVSASKLLEIAEALGRPVTDFLPAGSTTPESIDALSTIDLRAMHDFANIKDPEMRRRIRDLIAVAGKSDG